jgi:hypothetical protein
MISNQCLNDWWGFLPVDTTTEIPAQVPVAGWNPEVILTPSWCTRSRFAVRRSGEMNYRELKSTDSYNISFRRLPLSLGMGAKTLGLAAP